VGTIKKVIALLLLAALLLFLLGESVERRIWHYQLQSYNCEAVSSWNFDYVVVDLDEFNCDARGFSGKLLAYISVGEAEDYRDYWEGLPEELILYENPQWKGNYVVKFWDPRWKEIVRERILLAAERNFDGVYLDRVDVYYELNRKSEMVDLVCEIYGIAKELNLLVFVQNAVELYPDIAPCIDGFGKEDTWFWDDKPLPTPDGIEFLRMAQRDGKVILAVDYPRKMENVCKFYEECLSEGFYCTVSSRELNLNLPVTCPSS